MNTLLRKLLSNSVLHTIRTCWREIILFFLLGLGLTALGGVTDYAAAYFGHVTWVSLMLPSVSNYLQGFSRFIGAAIASGFLYALLWPTLNHFGNHSFDRAWDELTAPQKLAAYFSILLASLIAAAICFSAR